MKQGNMGTSLAKCHSRIRIEHSSIRFYMYIAIEMIVRSVYTNRLIILF